VSPLPNESPTRYKRGSLKWDRVRTRCGVVCCALISSSGFGVWTPAHIYGKIFWISSHFEKRRSDTHRRNISVYRLQVVPPYSGRGGPPVVKDPGKKLDQMGLWLAHNAPHFTVSTHLIGSLCPLTLLLIVVDLNSIY